MRVFAFLALVCSSRRSTVYNRSKQQRDNNMIGGSMSIYDPKTPKTLLMHSTMHYKDARRRASVPEADHGGHLGRALNPLEVTRFFLPLPLIALLDYRASRAGEEVQVSAIPWSGRSRRRQALWLPLCRKPMGDSARVQRPFWSTCRPCVVSLSYVFAP